MEDKSLWALLIGSLITVTGKAFSWVFLILIGVPLIIGCWIGGSMMLRKFMKINSLKIGTKGIEVHFDASRPSQQ